MKRRKEDIVIVILGLVLVIIMFTILFLSFTTKQNVPVQQLTQRSLPTATATPTTPSRSVGPPLAYDVTASQKLLDYFNNRRTLSSQDIAAKTTILSLLPSGEKSGVVYQTADFKIEYIHSADMFLIEILTPNIQMAKNEAETWLKEQGVSQRGICILPVEFYMNYNIANQLRQQNIIFSPLPDGC